MSNNPSGPRIKPPDQETANSALLRKFDFNQHNLSVPWLTPERRAIAADKIVDAYEGIVTLNQLR